MATLEGIDAKMNRKTGDVAGSSDSVKERIRKDFKTKLENGQQSEEDELNEEALLKKKQKEKPVKKPKVQKGFDTANYTKSIQLASEAQTGIEFYGRREATADYDGKDNNPADVMAGWDDYEETFRDVDQKERNLQHLVDERGYHTPEPDMDEQEMEDSYVKE